MLHSAETSNHRAQLHGAPGPKKHKGQHRCRERVHGRRAERGLLFLKTDIAYPRMVNFERKTVSEAEADSGLPDSSSDPGLTSPSQAPQTGAQRCSLSAHSPWIYKAARIVGLLVSGPLPPQLGLFQTP